MDRTLAFVRDLTGFVDRLADHVHDTAQGAVANRHHDRCIGVDHFLTAHQTLGGVHRDGTYRVFAQVLSNFEHKTRALVVNFKSVQDQRQVVIELDVDNGADDLGDPSDLFVSHIPNPRLDPVRALPRPR